MQPIAAALVLCFFVSLFLRIFPSLSPEQMTDVMATLDALIRATKLMYSGCVAVDTGYTKEVAAEYVNNLFSKAITLDLDPKYEHFQWLCVDSKMADKLKAKHPAPASAPRLAVATAPQPPPGWQPQYLPQYQYPPQYLPQPAAQYNQPPQYGQAPQEPHQQRGPNPKRNRVRSARRHAQHYACLELLCCARHYNHAWSCGVVLGIATMPGAALSVALLCCARHYNHAWSCCVVLGITTMPGAIG